MQHLLYGKRDSDWYVADFETITDNTEYWENNGDTRVILANSMNWKEEHFTFTSIDEWLNFHLKQNKNQTIFFHNLSFDGEFIISELKRLGWEPNFNNNDENPKSKTFDNFIQGNNYYYLRLYYRNPETGIRYRIIIRCSFKILQSSVNELGKSVGLAKHHPDDDIKVKDEKGRIRSFYDWEPKETINDWEKESDRSRRYLEYIKNDCLIVKRALDEFCNAVNTISFVKNRNEKVLKGKEKGKRGEEFNPLKELTTSSLTLSLMKMNVKEFLPSRNLWGVYPLKLDTETYKTIKPWYSGGYTQFNDEYTGNPRYIGESMFIDVSSAYPYQMTFSLPYGDILYERPEGKEGVNYYTFLKIRVKSAKIKETHKATPILRVWDKNDENNMLLRYTREAKNFTCYYTKFEWETINKFYDIKVDRIDQYFMKAMPYLKEYADELYKLKNHYSKTGQKGLKQGMKILINASYGKLCTRLKFESTFLLPSLFEINEFFSNLEKNKSIVLINNKKYVFNGMNEFRPDINKIRVTRVDDPEEGANVAAGAVITSRERVYLWEMIDLIGPEHFGYSDTDSIFFINLTKEKLELLNEITKETGVLGCWENEYPNTKIRYFGTFGAKKYQLLDENKEIVKSRCAGVSQNLCNIKELCNKNFDEEEIVIENAVFEKRKVKSGIILIKKDKKLSKGKI